MKRLVISLLVLNNLFTYAQCNFGALSNQSICEGQSATITAQTGFRSYLWSTGESTNAITVSPVVTTNYNCEVTCYGADLVSNGGFEQGNTGFNSAYYYDQYSTYNEGTYAVPADANHVHGDFWGTPHGGGKFLVVNGSSNPNTDVWCQNITVTPNTDYEFSTWGLTVSGGSPAQLRFSINGSPIGTLFSTPGFGSGWGEFFATWNSGTNTNITICIVNMNTSSDGNDFALDDILFRQVYSQIQPVVITVNPLPTVDFTPPTPVCVNTNGMYTDATISNGATLSAWQWDFTNDGVADDNNQNPSKIYSSPGNEIVTLSVTTAAGCKASATKNVVVNALPVVNFSADVVQGCGLLCVNFTNTTANSQSAVWQMSDGYTSASINASHCFSSGSLYDVVLTVTDNTGCVNSLSNSNMIDVYPDPVGGFSFSPQTVTLLDPIITIEDRSVGAVAWKYDFGDNSETTESSPQHIYDSYDTATYAIQQIVTNSYGCKDTVTKNLKVTEGFVFYCPNTFTPNADDINDIFLPAGLGIKECSFFVYDRWGNLIFQSNSISKGWDGKVNGRVALEDVYIVKAQVKDVFDKNHSYLGALSLLK